MTGPILLAALLRSNTAAESRDLALPLFAEGQHQHLLVDVRVLTQTAHRAAARVGENLKCRARLLIELRQRRDLRRLLAMHLEPELALEPLVLFRRDIDGVEGAVVRLELMDLAISGWKSSFFGGESPTSTITFLA